MRIAQLVSGAIALLLIGYVIVVALAWGFQRQIFYPAPQEFVAASEPMRDVTLVTADGLELNAWYREADEGQPTLVYFHGNGGRMNGSRMANEAFLEAGYGTLFVSYRGYAGNPGAPSEEGFYNDGRAAMAFLADQDVAVADTIIIGNSIGTGTAAQMAYEFDARALILVSPFTSLPDIAREKAPFLPIDFIISDRFDTLSKVAVLDMPVLVQAGQADTLIPLDHGRTLAEAAPNGRLQIFGGIGHELTFERVSQDQRLAWLEALEEPAEAAAER